MRRTARVALLISCALACDVATTETYSAAGTVEAVAAAGGQVKIAHEAIPGFMPAMTMNFDVASPELLENVRPGMRVSFRLERSATTLRITALEVVAEGAPPEVAGGLPLQASAEPAPEFRLVGHHGEPLALSELRGYAVLLDFIFTRCPGPCPILTSTHVTLQRRLPAALAERTRFLSISVDPEHDTPERLREYALARGADLARWTFLTGSETSVNDVLERYHIGTVRREDGTLDHVLVTFLIDPEGRIVRRYLGLEVAPETILEDLEEVLS